MSPITNTGAENMFVEGIGQIEVNSIVVTDLAMVIPTGCTYMDLNSIGFIHNAALDCPRLYVNILQLLWPLI
jgi:hypothetical protein